MDLQNMLSRRALVPREPKKNAHNASRNTLCAPFGCHPTVRRFDAALGYPSPPETIPTAELAAVCLLLPLGVIALVQMYCTRHVRGWTAKHDVHNAVLTVLQSALTVMLVTEVTKRYVGRCVLSSIQNPGDNCTHVGSHGIAIALVARWCCCNLISQL